MLRLINIQRTFQIGPTRLQVLQGVDLHVEPGEMLAIMGKSGSGKSTLMNIIGLLDRPTAGKYVLNGRSISHYTDDELSHARNELIGFVFQSFHLLPRLNASENVAIPLIYRGVSLDEQQASSLRVLTKVGMVDRSDHRPRELSGGQQQRVAIARALVGGPSLLLADEPTGALDPKIGNEIIELFLELNAVEGITIVIITHDPGVAERCKRTVIMEDGKLRNADG